MLISQRMDMTPPQMPDHRPQLIAIVVAYFALAFLVSRFMPNRILAKRVLIGSIILFVLLATAILYVLSHVSMQ